MGRPSECVFAVSVDSRDQSQKMQPIAATCCGGRAFIIIGGRDALGEDHLLSRRINAVRLPRESRLSSLRILFREATQPLHGFSSVKDVFSRTIGIFRMVPPKFNSAPSEVTF